MAGRVDEGLGTSLAQALVVGIGAFGGGSASHLYMVKFKLLTTDEGGGTVDELTQTGIVAIQLYAVNFVVDIE